MKEKNVFRRIFPKSNGEDKYQTLQSRKKYHVPLMSMSSMESEREKSSLEQRVLKLPCDRSQM